MNTLHPHALFDLTHYTHAKLFENCSYVWEALAQIDPYLASFPLGSIECDVPDGVHLVDRHLISIGKNTVLEPGAYIKGPCIIGNNCTVRHGAYIRGQFICGDHCVVGHTTEVKHSIFLNHAAAAHFAYVGDSILGNNVNLGAGTKCANLRFDNGQVIVHSEDKRIPTGLRKFGAIFGDGAQSGCNSVTNPGTILCRGAVCFPCANIGGVVSNGKVKT